MFSNECGKQHNFVDLSVINFMPFHDSDIPNIQVYLASPKFICCPKKDVKSLVVWATREGLLVVEQTICYYFFR